MNDNLISVSLLHKQHLFKEKDYCTVKIREIEKELEFWNEFDRLLMDDFIIEQIGNLSFPEFITKALSKSEKVMYPKDFLTIFGYSMKAISRYIYERDKATSTD